MFILRKVYCRIFQKAFCLALPILPYREPELLHSVTEIADVCKERKISSVMLVTDKTIRSLGLTEALEKSLKENEIACCIYDKTVPNPTISNVEEARELYLNNNAEAIIAFGGGCVNDTIIRLASSLLGFGGVGESGMGSYHGKKSFDTFSHEKSIVKKYTWLDLPMRYRPYNKNKDKMIRIFLK